MPAPKRLPADFFDKQQTASTGGSNVAPMRLPADFFDKQAADPFTPTSRMEPIVWDEGFWSTVKQMVGSLPELLTTNPITTLQNATAARHAVQQQAADARAHGDNALGLEVAGAIPFLGPALAEAGNEWGDQKYGQAMAHTLGLVLPFLDMGGAVDAASAAGRGARYIPPAMARGVADEFALNPLPPVSGPQILGTDLGLLGKAGGAVIRVVKGAKTGYAAGKAKAFPKPRSGPEWLQIEPQVSSAAAEQPVEPRPLTWQPRSKPEPVVREARPKPAWAALPKTSPVDAAATAQQPLAPIDLPTGRKPGGIHNMTEGTTPKPADPAAPAPIQFEVQQPAAPAELTLRHADMARKMAEQETAKDTAIAQHLHKSGVDAEQWLKATDEQKNLWIKAANPKYSKLGPSRGYGRAPAEVIADVAKHLRRIAHEQRSR
jgi:hypothetical protein